MERMASVGSYAAGDGLRLQWADGFRIDVRVQSREVTIKANKAGLVSLAQHLLTLAGDEVPSGTHIHLDASRELEEDSADLVLERAE